MSTQNTTPEVAIRISGVKKRYRLGQIGSGTIRSDFESWWARIRGKEDPNTIIGTDQRLVGQTLMALNGIDLTIYKGEAIGFIGGNGAGKSTLLKLLSRVTGPTEGEIDIYGRIVSMLEVGTGFHGEMTGRENVYLNGAILGMTKAEIDAKMDEIIAFSEVGDFIDTPVKRYSSGMYVKLAFSVAAHLDAEIMIMDEVLAVGDMAFQKKCLNRMRDAATREGRTVLYVSHNMNTIRQLCDRCVVMDKGKIIFEGDVEKGIECYIGSRMVNETSVDLSELKREKKFASHPATMQKIWTDSLDDINLSVGSKLRVKLAITGDRTFENTHIRTIIKAYDATPVTTCATDQGFTLTTDRREIALEIDTTGLTPGRYSVSPEVYQVDPMGNQISLDVLRDVFFFEIVDTPGFNNNMKWHARYWGNHYGDPIQYQIIC